MILSSKGGGGRISVVRKPLQLRDERRACPAAHLSIAKFPEIEGERRRNYSVIVTTNLFGDILSDLCAQLVGGMGFGYSGNIGDRYAVFEPTHGSAPKYAGMNKVNPLATILAAKMMLEWLGERDRAERIERAAAQVVALGDVRTYDMGGAATTPEMAQAVSEALRRV